MSEKFVDGFKLNESGCYKGIIECSNGAFCRYSLSPQAKGKYAYRGTMSILSPNGKGVLNITSKALRTINAQRTEKGLSKVESKNASHSIYIPRKYDENGFELDTIPEEDIKAYLIDHAKALYSENISAFSAGYDAFSSAADMYLPLAVELYASQYIDSRSKTPKAQEARLNKLKRAARQFSGKPIGRISARDISAARKVLGSNANMYLKEIQEFTEFLYSKKHVAGDINPFAQHNFQGKKPPRNPSIDQTKASNTDILSSFEEQKLNKTIEENWQDPKVIGLLLIKEGRLDSTDATQLKWGQLEWESQYPNVVFVKLKKDNIGGATHDFTFPIVGFGAKILHRHMEWVKSQADGQEIDKLPIVHEVDDIYCPLDRETLATSSREFIQGCGVGYARLTGRDDQHNVKYIDLLHKTYDNHRATTFGLGTSPSVLTFLMHNQLKRDVLADHYRSLTDESARHMLVTALSQPLPYEVNVKRKHNVSTTIVGKRSVTTIEAPESKKATHIVVDYYLKPGERIMVSSAHGVKVHYEAI